MFVCLFVCLSGSQFKAQSVIVSKEKWHGLAADCCIASTVRKQRGMNVCFMLIFPIPNVGPTLIDGIKIISSKYAPRFITLGILSSARLCLTLSITILYPSWIHDEPLYPYKWITSERTNMLKLFLVHINFMRNKVDKILII